MSRFARQVGVRTLTDDQVRTLLRAIGASPGGPVPLSEAIMLVHWCDKVTDQASLIQAVLLGHFHLRWPEGQPEPLFRLTPKGHAFARIRKGETA